MIPEGCSLHNGEGGPSPRGLRTHTVKGHVILSLLAFIMEKEAEPPRPEASYGEGTRGLEGLQPS